jgi:hypothetical protein
MSLVLHNDAANIARKPPRHLIGRPEKNRIIQRIEDVTSEHKKPVWKLNSAANASVLLISLCGSVVTPQRKSSSKVFTRVSRKTSVWTLN